MQKCRLNFPALHVANHVKVTKNVLCVTYANLGSTSGVLICASSTLEPYYCQGCLQQHLPFSCILNTDSDVFNLENANESLASIPPSLINDAVTENDVNHTISCQYYNSGHFIEHTKQQTTKDLFMVHCNVRSLNKNLCDLQQYFSELYYEPDIIAISETRTNSTNAHLPDHQMHGYIFSTVTQQQKQVEWALILKTQ